MSGDPCNDECGPKKIIVAAILIVTGIMQTVFLFSIMKILRHATSISDFDIEAVEQVVEDWGVQSYTSMTVISAIVDENGTKYPPQCADGEETVFKKRWGGIEDGCVIYGDQIITKTELDNLNSDGNRDVKI